MAEIRIIDRDADVLWIEATGAFGKIEVITNSRWDGNSLVLYRLHIDGMGAGTAGLKELKNLVRQFGKEQGARRVIIEGARRTTGANPGHIPRPIVVEMDPT
jgi:hypothetical protein